MGNETDKEGDKEGNKCLYVFRDLLNTTEADSRKAGVGKHALQSAVFIQNG